MGGFGLDFPGIELAEGQPFVDDRPWLSASHPEALAPMAVALTRHAFGDDLAAALAAVLQPDAQRERATRAALQDRRIPATRNSVLAHAIAWLEDRKSTRLNSSHLVISYAVFCLKKKKIEHKAILRADNRDLLDLLSAHAASALFAAMVYSATYRKRKTLAASTAGSVSAPCPSPA